MEIPEIADGISQMGPIRQLSFVPKDLEKSLHFWTSTMGVGPFYFMRHLDLPEVRYRGKATRFDFSLGLAYWGDVQIELIQQHDDIPSIYSDWLRAGHEGLHHVCLFVEDVKKARDRCSQRGYTIVQEFDIPESGAFYADTGGGPGSTVEFLEMNSYFTDLFATIQAASLTWDGSDPVREIA